MTKPLFRIEQLISALLKGSPDDPVYLKVGPTTYGIKSITDGSIRVTTGSETQDAAQVVKTLRRYATGTPKGEDTGIAWRIVGVGGGTAIKSVSHDGSRIVVTTLANEGKAAEESGGCHHCGKKGHDSKGLCVSCNKPWFGPRTKDIFEAPRSERKTTPGKRAHNSAVSSKISQIMKDYDKTGRIGSSKPKNRAAAIKQAVAVAYSMVNKDYSKKGKRLPTGVRRAENQVFGAPMGYAPDGPRPFYGNPRKLVRDRWGNLRFIRRRKDGTYMDNVDFGRSIRADRQRQAKTWAPGGFRDQGDGSLDLLTSLMGAEEFTLPDGSKVMVEDVSEINEGFEPFDLDGVDFIAWSEELFSMPVNCGICNGPSQYYEDNDNVCMTCDSTWVYDEGGDEGEGYYRKSNMAAESAESGDFVWVLILESDRFEDEMGGVFTSKDEAKEVFSDYLRNLGGDPDGIDWDADVMVWLHDEEDDPSLGEHSIRLYQEKLDDPDFSKYYAAEDVYVHGDDGEARSIRVNKTHARNMSNLDEGATTTVKDQRKGTQHTVKRVGKGFEHAAESGDTGKWFIIPMQELLWEGAEGDYWNAGTPCSMDPDDFMDDYAEEIYDLDEVFFNVPWPQVYNPTDPVVNVDTGEAFMLDKREEEYGSPIIAILIRVKDQEIIDQFIMEGNRAFDRPPTFELDSDETISDWDLVVIDGQRHKILVGPWDNDDPDYEKQEMERESVRKEVFARGGLGPGGYRHPVVWLVESWMDGVSDGARLFSKESDARAVFEGYIRDLRGDPADASDGDWVADEGFQRVRMYQVMIE